MDWRLQTTGLLIGGAVASIPYSVLSDNVWDPATASAWNLVVSVMQYLLVVGLAVTVLGLLWQGRVGRKPALATVGLSIGVGAWMLLVEAALAIYWFSWTENCPDPTLEKCFVTSAMYPTGDLVIADLLIPALCLFSSIVWLVRHRARVSPGLQTQA